MRQAPPNRLHFQGGNGGVAERFPPTDECWRIKVTSKRQEKKRDDVD
jgi:hypothetical protein